MTKRDFSYGIIPVRNVNEGFEFLIIHQAVGHWTFPKGHKEGIEMDLEAARRELQEETGIKDIEIIPDIEFVAHYPLPENDKGFADKEVKFFLGFVKGGEAKVPESFGHEIFEARWCKKEEVEKLFERQEWKKLLEEANNHLLENYV